MSRDRIEARIDEYWRECESSLAGLDGASHARLNTAIAAVDLVWDRHIFEAAETFGGTEIGYARALSGAILARLIGADFAALVSVAGSEIPSSGDPTLDQALDQARREAMDTFSGDLLGPVRVGEHLISAQPMVGESPIPFGAAVIATREELGSARQTLLRAYLRDLDTRLDLAETLLRQRWRNLDLTLEVRTLKGEVAVPETTARPKYVPLPEDAAESLGKLIESISGFDLFGVPVPAAHFAEFCRVYDGIVTSYLKIFAEADHLFLDVPSGVDAKDEDSKHAAAYNKLLQIMKNLRPAARLLYHTSAEDMAPFAATNRAPTFADLTRVAMQRAEDETTTKILEIMNDRGEEAELEALAARHHPFEFRAANIGEVFALLALHQTVMDRMPENSAEFTGRILRSLRSYQAARAYLLAYDSFEDVPFKGVDRTRPPEADNLLLVRAKAPAIGVLLSAFSR
jgi:hypothetical protein